MSDAPAPPLLRVAGLRFRWPRTEHECVHVARLDLAAGQTLFVRGPSGCGKSTLLSLLAGVLTANDGTVELLGRDWRRLAPAARDRHRADHVGVLFQQFNLLPYLSVLDNVLLPCRFSARRAARAGDTRAAARQLLDAMGLHAPLNARPASQLSVGQQQRVAAARALIGAPELVIADEPTSALDEALREAFMRLLLNACRGGSSALVFVSHDERLARHFDRRLDLPQSNAAVPLT